MAATGASPKTKLVAFLLCTFLGTVGAHRFYVGRIGGAVGQLLLTIAGSIFAGVGVVVALNNAVVGGIVGVIGNIIIGAVGIWVFVDWIMILVTKFKDKHGQVLTSWTK
jgi:TM2 domain-containing membrane protein YozV